MQPQSIYEVRVRRTFVELALAASCGVAACNGCRPSQTPRDAAAAEKPTVRLYLVSDAAGALEPCGCVKDQLGGLDHVASLMLEEKKKTPDSVLVSAGPLFFLDPVIKSERQAQEKVKAETMADVFKGLDFVAFAPGRNDWALGQGELSDLATRSGGSVSACNVAPPGGLFHASVMRTTAGIKVGFIGVARPDKSDIGAPLGALAFEASADAVKKEADALTAQGAQVLVAIAAVGRGEAKRIADVVPSLTAILVGAVASNGEDNTTAPPPEMIGNVLVAETSNHLQTVGVLDLFVRNGSFVFHDAGNIALSEKRKELETRIDQLHAKIADWEKDPKIATGDLAARRADLAKLETQRKALDEAPAPKEGSFFRYHVQEIRDSLGSDDSVKKQFLAYYKKVDDMNRRDFADRVPPPPAPNGDAYAGIAACVPCHAAPKAVWDKTAHAHAYATLATEFKEFNLDCVSCHVTGYEEPGGSSVTHVEKLKDVQCETCHGPSSRHVADPKTVKVPIPRPGTDHCTTCHHPPHVHSFDASAKLPEILGPGHGLPLQ